MSRTGVVGIGKMHLSQRNRGDWHDIISDVDHYDELDYEIKLEDNDEEQPITILITNSNKTKSL